MRSAFAKLSKDFVAQLLNNTILKEIRTPDLRNIKNKVISITYVDNNPNFLKKLTLECEDPINITFFLHHGS